MKKFSKILFLIVFFFIFIPYTEAKQITINLFYSETCPHCAKEKEVLEEYKQENDDIEVNLYEVTKNESNSKMMNTPKKAIDVAEPYVPFTVIGEH